MHMSQPPSNTATAKDRFDCLHGALITCGPRLIHETVTVATLLLVAAGWLLTSEDALSMIQGSKGLSAVAVSMCAVTAVAYTLAMYRHVRLSNRLMAQLSELDFMGPEYYEHHRVSKAMFLTALGVNYWHYLMVVLLLTRGSSAACA